MAKQSSHASPRHRLRALRWAVAAALVGVVAAPALASPVTVWPTSWVAALLGGTALNDPEGDTPGPRDVVGNAANPMLYVSADATHIYFRLRVDSDPAQSATNFAPFGWGCFINTDANTQTYEFSTIINGVNNPDEITFFKNTVTTTANSPDDPPDLPPLSTVLDPLAPAVSHARVVPAGTVFPTAAPDADFFIDWAIDRSVAEANGFDPSQPANYYCGSSNNGTTIGADCSGGAATGCPLDSQFSDPISCSGAGCGVCGDGALGGPEGCDDGNRVSGDGCTSTCLRELGQACTLSAQCASAFCDPASNACACDQDADCATGLLCNTLRDPNACVTPGCGNGLIETGEACDDSNTAPGDGCSSGCLLELGQPCGASALCASAFCDPASNTCACDASADCPSGQLCNTTPNPNTCVDPGCGNGVLEASEACEDANLVNGDGCNSSCLRELGQPCTLGAQCASAFCDPAGNVCACDQDADCAAGALCNTTLAPNACVTVGCGNGVLEAGEGCDDSNLVTGDGCNASCLRELGQACALSAQCASAFCDPAGNVCACDGDADCPGVQLCSTTPNPNTCVAPGCGNGVLEPTEACDDGNLATGDGCNAACLLELGQPCGVGTVCASQFCDLNVCACDQSADCAGGLLCNLLAAPNTCVAPGCGNGVLEASEGCDDGGTATGDGCGATCLKELGQSCTASATCESAFCDTANNTCACDADVDCPAGRLCATAATPNACVLPGCGNNVLEATEACEDGNLAAGDGCNGQCLLELGEPCPADAACASTFCDPAGNVCACNDDLDCSTGELCNTVASPNQCTAPGCGNNVLEATEGCDDGNLTPGDGCDAACLRELGEPCTSGAQCASQLCDPAGNLCACNEDLDCPAGQLCALSATPNACVLPGCGNGVLESGEACEDSNTTPGDGCNATCLLELGEPCTGSAGCESGLCDPAGNLCACDQDSDCPGSLLCNTVGAPNTCVAAGCGNGVLEPSEACEDGNTSGGDGCSAACLLELGQACPASAACESGLCDTTDGRCACNDNADCPTGQLCALLEDPNQCVLPGCGNLVLEAGEGCDDGGTAPGDGCGATCLLELGEPCAGSAGCESGLCDAAGNVCACDQDSDCPTGLLCALVAAPNACVAPGCGNGVLESTEACDDANTAAGDGCGATCLKELGEPCALGGECESAFCDSADGTCACDQDSDCAPGAQCNVTLAPNQCVPAGCGNGVLGVGEGCDDANLTNGDGCDAQCLKELGQPCTGGAVCASAFCDPSGFICACDQDADCAAGDLCRTGVDPNACVNPGCGNGVLEAIEACDDGNTAAGDGCGSGCLKELLEACAQSAECESSFCDPADGTCACDDDVDCGTGAECNIVLAPNQCVPVGCGNGVLGTGEACDDANLTAGDGCNPQCLLELGQPCSADAACASALCDPAGSVCACNDDADCGGGLLCNLTADPNACVAPGCGNAVLESTEACEDGNTADGDGCNSACLREIGQACSADAQCASAFCDPADGTCACDADADCPTGELCNTSADPNACVAPGCGNSVLESTEACEDGNTADGDGCNSACLREIGQACSADAQCASAFCDPADGTCACDADADCASGQECNTTLAPNECVPVGCGNGVLVAPEGCDDGNLATGDGCNAQCLLELGQACLADAACASAFCDPADGTCACDADIDCPTGELCNTSVDPNACVAPGCGNGVLESTEACEDGNTADGDGCNSACLREIGQACTQGAQCASAFCDAADGTCACDDDADCASGQECNTLLAPNACITIGCGNGVVAGAEACDDGNLVSGDGCTPQCLLELGQPCPTSAACASGFCDPAGNLCACDADADCPTGQLCSTTPDPNACVAPGCGNGVLEATEGCDDANTVAGDGCSATCLLELGEPCTASASCESAFCEPSSGVCACDADSDCATGEVCNTTPPAACVAAGCGNGVLETGEGCDDQNTTAGDGCGATCLLELGEACTDSANCESALCDTTGVCACDDDADCATGEVCNTSADPNVCAAAGCGNGVLETGEGCDDQNTTAGDGCSAACLLELGETCTDSATCESGLCDGSVCACDADADCPTGELCDTAATPNACVASICGDGALDGAEACDDQNTTAGDGCSATCTVEPGFTCAGEPSVCTPIAECDDDGDCTSPEVCDEPAGVCVECTEDAHCGEAGTCDLTTHTCNAPPTPVEGELAGGGCACGVSRAPAGEGLAAALAGVLALSLRRRRRASSAAARAGHAAP